MAERVFLAIDLGASSGRVLAGRFDGSHLRLDEVHRFHNGPVAVGESLHWDVLSLWAEVQNGLRAAQARYGDAVESLGVDTWGVDFGLLGRGDVLLGNPYHYRDHRTDGMIERACAIVPREAIFARTGLQFLSFNTLFQLLAMRVENSPLLDMATSLLMMPDLFHWLLTGEKANERTNATTTQFFDPVRGHWATDLLEKLDLPGEMLNRIVAPGTRLGPLRSGVSAETGLSGVEVILPGTHDTASAVVAVPVERAAGDVPDWCYISSGTWSLLGVELARPVINDVCREYNFTNEGGVGGTIRLLKNIAGLWLVQECRRVWSLAGHDYSWDQLAAGAAQAPPLVSLVDPDAADFLAPGDMPEAIRSFCARTAQPVPDSDAAVVRTAIESLALKCRFVLSRLEELTGQAIETIHIVGGGTQNRVLCRATADACGRRVVAGPVEATAIGNLAMQAVAVGALGSISEARACIRRSFDVEEYEPQAGGRGAWDDAYGRFVSLLN